MGDIAFEALAEPPRLRVADTVGNEQYELHLDSPVDPEPVSTEGFTYPVSDAVRVETSGFELRGHVRMHLWDADGEFVQVLNQENEVRFPDAEYSLEFCLPLKTYLKFSSPVRFESDTEETRIVFEGPTAVTMGVRSPRKQPAATITTTVEPTDIMEAFSFLGEGLMTTTPMRSYPNLRGYPPEIRLGDRLDVPSDLDPGSQSVTVTLPPQLENIFEAAPLIYYLNADVRPGSRPTIDVEGEPVFEFSSESFTEEIETVLGHVFVLDCVVRTGGPYPIESAERDHLEDVVPRDFEELYQADSAERLRTYLDVPFEPVAEQVPPWPTTGYIEPKAENVDAIPHLVAQLAPVKSTVGERLSGAEARRAALEAFIEGGSGTRAASKVFEGEAQFVDTGVENVNGDVWIGDDVPIRANKLLVDGFRNRFARESSDRTSIDVTIVCNERWMSGEAMTVETYYGEREDLPFEVTFHEDLDCSSLLALLESETDFLHYVGHATMDGLKCRDGYLDVASASSIGVETFLLNACQSYQQAMKLIGSGAIGGIATLSDVTDDQAAVVGRTVARLLNLGFPLRGALEVARSQSIVGGQYLSVGDDSVTLVPADSVPHKGIVESTDGGYELTVQSEQTGRVGSGALFSPWTGSQNQQYLIGKSIGPYELTPAELREFLEPENLPVDFDGEFRWAFDLAEELA